MAIAQKLGLDFIVLTGNSETRVINNAIEENILVAKKYFEGIIVVGKMDRSSVDKPVINLKKWKIHSKYIILGVGIQRIGDSNM